MARTGSSGFTTNPFGTGSLGGLSQYNLGDSLRDLERYQAEVAWANGQLPDEDYLAVLRKDVQAAAPGTRDYISAVNRLDDVTYRINRQRAELVGLDALIAFDQQTLATMRDDNLRYRDVKDSLASELARRRSRDYGNLVDDYNAGKGGSTEALLAWVRNTISSLPDDAPDKDDWPDVEADLAARVDEEKDAEVYQDYQQRRMKPEAFLAYVRSRRDSYDPDSPKYDEWSRRVEDAEKNVRDTVQGEADQAFFNRYNEGKVSDKAYLKYIRDRLNGMAPDDPGREEWRHRLAGATFAIAEDQLIFDVNRGKRPMTALVSFYRDYRTGLNRGSAEWRRITDKITSLAGRSGGGGGGGGGGSSAGGSGGRRGGNIGGERVVGKDGDISTYLAYLTPDINANPANRRTAEKFLSLNYDSLQNAVTRGDTVWVFYDPQRPRDQVQARDPITGEPVVGKDGKPVMVPGSKWLPVTNQALADLDMVKAGYNYSLALGALRAGKPSDYAMYLGRAINSQDHARYVQAKSVLRDVTQALDTIDKGIEYAESMGDAATVVNLLRQQGNLINAALRDGALDESRRVRLEGRLEELARNPLWPAGDDRGNQIGGLVDIATSPRDRDGNLIPGTAVLRPGTRFVLDRVDAAGKARPGFVFDDSPPGVWEQNHRTIHTTRDGQLVSGDVTLQRAGTNQKIVVRTDVGEKIIDLGPTADYVSFVDGRGDRVHAYSIDGGRSWLQTDGSRIPLVSVTNPNLRYEEAEDGTARIVDMESGKVAFAFDGTTWKPDQEWVSGASMEWYGQSDRQPYRDRFTRPEIGGGGLRGVVRQANSDGSINIIPEETRLRRYAEARADKSLGVSRRTGGERARGAEAFEAADDRRRDVQAATENARWASSFRQRSDAAKRAESARFDAASGDSRTASRVASLSASSQPPATRTAGGASFGRSAGGATFDGRLSDEARAVAPVGLRRAAPLDDSLPTARTGPLPALPKPATLRTPDGKRNLDVAPAKRPRKVQVKLPKPKRATTTTATGTRTARPLSGPQAM